MQKFVVPAPDLVWRPGIEAGAAIYLVGRAVQFVTIGSDQENEAVSAGGMRIGTLSFNRESGPMKDADSLRRVTARRTPRIQAWGSFERN